MNGLIVVGIACVLFVAVLAIGNTGWRPLGDRRVKQRRKIQRLAPAVKGWRVVGRRVAPFVYKKDRV